MSNREKRRELKRKFIRKNLDIGKFFSSEIPLWKQYATMLIVAAIAIPAFYHIGTFICWLVAVVYGVGI